MDKKRLENRGENKRKNSELNLSCVLARPISFETSICVFFGTYYFESSILVVGIYVYLSCY